MFLWKTKKFSQMLFLIDIEKGKIKLQARLEKVVWSCMLFLKNKFVFKKNFFWLCLFPFFKNFFSHSILHILDSREFSCLTCLMKKKKKQTLSKWGFDFSEFYLHLVPSTFFFFFSFLFKKTSPKSREGTFLFLMVDFFFVTTL